MIFGKGLGFVGDEGLETPPNSSGETPFLGEGAAESGARPACHIPEDADLQAIVAAWPRLPVATRAAILSIIEGPDVAGT